MYCNDVCKLVIEIFIFLEKAYIVTCLRECQNQTLNAASYRRLEILRATSASQSTAEGSMTHTEAIAALASARAEV